MLKWKYKKMLRFQIFHYCTWTLLRGNISRKENLVFSVEASVLTILAAGAFLNSFYMLANSVLPSAKRLRISDASISFTFEPDPSKGLKDNVENFIQDYDCCIWCPSTHFYRYFSSLGAFRSTVVFIPKRRCQGFIFLQLGGQWWGASKFFLKI